MIGESHRGTAITDTAELIAELNEWPYGKQEIYTKDLICKAATALAAQAQEIERLTKIKPLTQYEQQLRDDTIARIRADLVRLGYVPEGDRFDSSERLMRRSAQFRLRQEGENPRSFEEVETAIAEGLVFEGGAAINYRGDGLSIAAQIVWAQHQRAEAAEARVEQLAKMLQESHDKWEQALEGYDAIEAKTIERCAQVADSGAPIGIAAAIRALPHIGEEG